MFVNKELRKVPAAILDPIAEILHDDDAWKTVMSVIPKVPKDLHSDQFVPKYNSEHIRLVERHAQENKLKYAKVLFDEWGTSGRIRPTLQTLMDVLIKADMYRAAESLAALINVKLPPRPTHGPPADICTDVSSILNSVSSVQKTNDKESNGNCSGTNKTYEALGNVPTKKIGSATVAEDIQTPVLGQSPSPISDLWKFSKSDENFPNFEAMDIHSTTMIPNNNSMPSASNLIQFTKDQYPLVPSSEYIPRFSALLPPGNDVDNSAKINMSGSSAVSNQSEMSHSTSESIPPSDESVSSQFQMQSLDITHLVETEILEDTSLIRFNYAELKAITNNFTGTHVGTGGFGDVFVGDHETQGKLAIKRAHMNQSMQSNLTSNDTITFFNSEVKSLAALRHKNIVPIIGYAIDGPAPCIVCKYIERGSLLENIAAKILDENQRMNIMIGTAEGLKYIHNTQEKSNTGSKTRRTTLHGDVKSANILISKDYVPMLCDFGLSKQCGTTCHTEYIRGTSAYMAPEKFSGTITQKSDIFSYGIVLLELLTGLEPIVNEANSCFNIKVYVEEKCPDNKINTVLDPKLENWCKAQSIYELAKLCMKMDKNKRPSIDQICDTLYKINESEKRVFYAEV